MREFVRGSSSGVGEIIFHFELFTIFSLSLDDRGTSRKEKLF